MESPSPGGCSEGQLIDLASTNGDHGSNVDDQKVKNNSQKAETDDSSVLKHSDNLLIDLTSASNPTGAILDLSTLDDNGTNAKSIADTTVTEPEALSSDNASTAAAGVSMRRDPHSATAKKKEEPLCGYLRKTKITPRRLAPGGGAQRRWCVYDEREGCLKYYKSHEDMANNKDLAPMGQIDITLAAFYKPSPVTTSTQRNSNSRVFRISCASCTYEFEAPDDHTADYWLQRLQEKRRRSNVERLKAYAQRHSHDQNESILMELEESCDAFSARVPLPEGTIGVPSANTPHTSTYTPAAIAHSLSNITSDLRNAAFSGFGKLRRVNSTDNPTSHDARSRSPRFFDNLKKKLSVTKQPSEDTVWYSDAFTISEGGETSESVAVIGDAEHGQQHDSTHPVPATLHYNNTTQHLVTSQQPTHATEQPQDTTQKDLDATLPQGCDTTRHSAAQWATQYIDDNQDKEDNVQSNNKSENVSNNGLDADALAKESESHAALMSQIHALKQENKTLREDLDEQKACVAIKDEIIDTLSVKLHDTKTSLQRQESATPSADSGGSALASVIGTSVAATTAATRGAVVGCLGSSDKDSVGSTESSNIQLQQLQDSVEAYEIQNQFLNCEILELQKLRQKEQYLFDELYFQYKHAQAKMCQIESKYFVVLDQLSNVHTDSETTKLLLADAMKEEDIDSLTQSIDNPARRERKYDSYGFVDETAATIRDLALHARKLEQKSHQIAKTNLGNEAELKSRWDTLRSTQGLDHRGQEFKALVRAGVPNELRPLVWSRCVSLCVSECRAARGPQYYKSLIDTYDCNTAHKQIELDLLRTLPNNRQFESLTSPGIAKLRRILMAYTLYNPDIGYCQGLNRLVAIALLYLEEEDAFWCLVAIVDYLMPSSFYTRTLIGAQVDQRVLKDLLQSKVPAVASHFTTHQIDVSLFSFSWFITVFVDSFPTHTYLRIWDCFLYEGSKVLFRFALAIFKIHEAEILDLDEPLKINSYLRCIGENMHDVAELVKLAYDGMNPFPMRTIASKRKTYGVKVQEEINKFEEMRQKHRTEQPLPRPTIKNRETCLSDDDEE